MEQANKNEQVFRDLLGAVETHVRGMWRYRRRAIILMWAICIAGWTGVYMLPDVYEANARVYVDTENVIRPLLQGIATSSDVMSEVSIVTRELLSRPNLADVARETDLNLRADTVEEFDNLLDYLQDRIDVSGNRENIFSISFSDTDRETALAVVDSLVKIFVEKSLGADRSEAIEAQKFLTHEIGTYEQRLTSAEDELAEFKKVNVEYMPSSQGDYFSRLQTSRTALSITEGKLQTVQERRKEILRQLEGEEPVFGIMP